MSALALTHLPDCATGLVGKALRARGVQVDVLDLPAASSLPSLDGYAGLVSFGGQMSALDLDRLPFLAWELELLAAALARRIPVIGLCLGAQMLAAAAGGRVRRLERRFLDWVDLVHTPAAAADPLFLSLPASCRVLEWHVDAIEPPPDAVILASTSGPGASLFRVGETAWGSQLRLELTPEMLSVWLEFPSERLEVEEAGVDIGHLQARARTDLLAQIKAAAAVFDRFVDVVLDRAPR